MYILASDYDGTLNRGGISVCDREAIAAFRHVGHLFGVVTGRDHRFYDTITRDGVEIDFILALNGAMTVSASGETAGQITGAVSAENNGTIRGIFDIVSEYGGWLSCAEMTEHRTFSADAPDGGGKYAPLGDMDRIARFNSLNTQLETEDMARECTERINRAYGHTVNALQNYICIDIPPRGVDKGEGLARFARGLGVPEEHVFTAGDNLNDLAMIRRFHGCAVENALPEVKEAAEAVFPDVAAIIGHILSLGD